MKSFIGDDFLLSTPVARRLYREYAAPQPIYDYHSHLSAQEIARNRRFDNLYEAWLSGDHYKWRAMRWNGVSERYCTGDATPWEKFLAFARTVPKLLRNPLYHWTHLELKFYFGIEELLDEHTAKSIWARANERLASMPVRELIRMSHVAVLCTTDDPVDALDDHQQINADASFGTRVYPTFRPDNAMAVDQPDVFNTWLQRLTDASRVPCDSFAGFRAALRQRHDHFHHAGGRLSDHGLEHCDARPCTDAEAARIFDAARDGHAATPADAASFQMHLMVFFGHLDAERGWTKQLHLGPLRATSTRARREIGPNTGFDSIGDSPQADGLARYLDTLDRDGRLPKTVLYNVNPADNYVFASMAGNFQDGSLPGKVQFGSGWWFLDQKEGMQWQLNALSNVGLLSRFVGMLTDSRSFLSFPRHDYFRRILCDMLGRDVANGELPDDVPMLGTMVADICFGNAYRYFGLLPDTDAEPLRLPVSAAEDTPPVAGRRRTRCL